MDERAGDVLWECVRSTAVGAHADSSPVRGDELGDSVGERTKLVLWSRSRMSSVALRALGLRPSVLMIESACELHVASLP